MLGEDDDPHVGIRGADSQRRIYPLGAVAGWHSDVRHDNVGALPIDDLEQPVGGADSRDQDDFSGRLERPAPPSRTR